MVLAISMAFATFIPYYGGEALDGFFSFNAVNIGILYAITIGFLMMLAINRKQALDSYISMELNKLRRMYHLAKHLHEATPGTDKWFHDIDKAITAYLRAFKQRDFSQYERGNPLHRKITYAIYGFPQVTRKYNAELYGSLLDAAASTTEAREYIRSTNDASIGYYQWFVTLSTTTVFAFIIIAASPLQIMTRMIAGTVIFCLLLMIQLLYEYDRANHKKRSFYTKLYLQNEAIMKNGGKT
jgi:hypothetical protein